VAAVNFHEGGHCRTVPILDAVVVGSSSGLLRVNARIHVATT
jgi:hypothetical protein